MCKAEQAYGCANLRGLFILWGPFGKAVGLFFNAIRKAMEKNPKLKALYNMLWDV